MKKKIIGLLTTLAIMGNVTGCTSDEIAYLQMTQELLSHTGVLDADGTINISLDADRVVALAQNISEVAGYPHAVIANTLSNFSNFNKQHNFRLDYDISMDLNSLNYDMKLMAEYDNVEYNLGNIYFSELGVSVTPDTIIGAIKLYNACANQNNDYLSNPDFLTAFETNLRSIGIISLSNNTKVVPNDHSIGYDNQKVIDSVLKFYNNAFSSFSSGMVTKTHDGGYEIYTTGQNAVNLVYSAINYITNNFGEVHKAFTDYTIEVGTLTGASSQDLQDIASLLGSFDDYSTTNDAVVMLDGFKTSMQDRLSDHKASSIVNSLTYNSKLTKANDTTFNAIETLDIANDGNGNTLSYSNNVKYTLSSAKNVNIPIATSTMENVKVSNQDLVKQYNPVTDITLLWSQYGQTNTALLTEYRSSSFNVPFVNENYSVNYIIIDNSMYAPLRAVTEGFGENVGWDANTKTVIITKQDGTSHNMQGVIIDGSTMIKIRDFENLGYTVLYEELDENLRKATISR